MPLIPQKKRGRGNPSRLVVLPDLLNQEGQQYSYPSVFGPINPGQAVAIPWLPVLAEPVSENQNISQFVFGPPARADIPWLPTLQDLVSGQIFQSDSVFGPPVRADIPWLPTLQDLVSRQIFQSDSVFGPPVRGDIPWLPALQDLVSRQIFQSDSVFGPPVRGDIPWLLTLQDLVREQIFQSDSIFGPPVRADVPWFPNLQDLDLTSARLFQGDSVFGPPVRTNIPWFPSFQDLIRVRFENGGESIFGPPVRGESFFLFQFQEDLPFAAEPSIADYVFGPFEPVPEPPPPPPPPPPGPQPTIDVFIAGYGKPPADDDFFIFKDLKRREQESFVGYIPPGQQKKERPRNVIYNFASDIPPDSRHRVLAFLHEAELRGLLIDRSQALTIKKKPSFFASRTERAMFGGTIVKISPDNDNIDRRLPLAKLGRDMGFRLVAFDRRQIFVFDEKSAGGKVHPVMWITAGVGIGYALSSIVKGVQGAQGPTPKIPKPRKKK